MEKRWSPMEGSPDVITKFVASLEGPSNIQFLDVWSLEKDCLDTIPSPVLALTVLYPISEASEELAVKQAEGAGESEQYIPKDLWFIKQTIANECGTIAVLHITANIKDQAPCVSDGLLEQFFKSVENMTPEEKAKALGENEEFKKAQAKAASDGQSRVIPAEEDVNTHFVAFVQKENYLFELDGRKKFPINHGPTTSEYFLKDAVKKVQELFMHKDSQEIRFSIIAVVKNGKKDG